MTIKLRIDLYSHFFKIRPIDRNVGHIISQFAFRWTVKEFIRGGNNGGNKVQIKCVFGLRVNGGGEYRFHINQYTYFIDYLKANNIHLENIEIKTNELYTPKPINIDLKDTWELKDYQETARSFINSSELDKIGRTRLLGIRTGGGKAQPLDALIKTPTGWVTMAEISVGDAIVSQDGSLCSVIGTFPQGEKDVYSISFKDGRVAECCLEHLWKVSYFEDKNKITKIIDTQNIIKLLSKGIRLFIDLIIPSNMGTIIGVLDEYFNKKNVVRTSKSYLITKTSYELSTAKHLQSLVWSIGGICELIITIDGNYKLKIKHKILQELYVCNMNNEVRNSLNFIMLEITNVLLTGYKECKCISIDHPSKLYITNDYIVTHNTVTGIASAADNPGRICIVVLPKYIDKWGSDCLGILDIKPKDIMVVQGSSQMTSLLMSAVDDQIVSKVIIISLVTIRNLHSLYEEKGPIYIRDLYGCTPEEMFFLLNVSVLIIDEGHEHIHATFKLMLFTHVPKLLTLTATMMSEDKFIENMQQIMYPNELRLVDTVFVKYITCVAMSYRFKENHFRQIRTTEFGRTDYSQNAFERSMLKNNMISINYYNMIVDCIKESYIKNYKPGDKCIIFASRVETCTFIAKNLKLHFRHLNVTRYCKSVGDPYLENAIQSDIRVTSHGSAGTGLDIPGLTTAVMIDNKSSIKLNIQILGRLREIPGRDIVFYWVYCEKIKKHVEYSNKRKLLFKDRVKFINDIRYNKEI